MPSFDLIPLLVQTGYAGLFIALLIYVLRRQQKREDDWVKERKDQEIAALKERTERETEWALERKERHTEFMRIHEEHLKMQRETIAIVGSLKIVMQQWMDQSRPPFIDWDGETERRKKR